MDELKHRAGEKLEALHIAAKTAADGGKSRINDVVSTTSETIRKLREAFQELWQNELFMESRLRVAAWTRDAVQRIREGTPPLSPVLLYEELVALFKDRVWRRSVLIFACGAAIGGGAGLCVGLRAASRAPAGPHARALHSHADQSVILVEDAIAPGAGSGEVLIRVQAFSVCPVDRGVLRGRGSALRSLIARTQLTVGRGFTGVVLDVGPGVGDLEMGDEVWGCVSEWAGGAASELLTVRSTRVSKRPRSVSADGAATLPWAGSQALAALEALQLTPDTAKGKRVAICGAASGEGCVLIQLLSAWGAHLTVLAPRHTALTLQDLGAQDFVDMDEHGSCWQALEHVAARAGPWHAALACPGALAAAAYPSNVAALLKATAPRNAIVDLRPRPLISDRLPGPLSLLFAASFYSLRVVRWICGKGTHTDWLESPHRLTGGLEELAQLVDAGTLAPVLDKVYIPQDFENALAHACSEDAIGTTVIRFP
ncbi:reticulon-4-interacting protein 1, mitochondrial-like [Ostrinia nubilalis]|uniref:reticulon-4-interacting protein 1, mitochondrial-like n=1 Tax=Ostrinia nubilalis TaxID=29057 RepID=UPI003082598A